MSFCAVPVGRDPQAHAIHLVKNFNLIFQVVLS